MNLLCTVRGCYGLAQLAAPGVVGQLVGLRLDGPQRSVTRVLGARHLSQAVVSAPAPNATVLALGVEVDLLHSASMIALAAADRRLRRPALTSAAVAAGFAAAGMFATSQLYRRPGAAPTQGPLQVRDRWAQWLARRLLPARLRELGDQQDDRGRHQLIRASPASRRFGSTPRRLPGRRPGSPPPDSDGAFRASARVPRRSRFGGG